MAQKKEFSRKIYRVQDSTLVIVMGKVDGNRLTYEEYDKEQQGIILREATLINATPVTGDGMVIVAGQLIDNTIEVLKMVDLAENLAFKVGDGEKSIGFFSSKELKKVEEKTSSSGKPFHKLKFAAGENKSVILNAFGFKRLADGEVYPLVIQPATDSNLFDIRESEFERGGEMTKWKTFYGFSPMQFQ